MRPSTGPAQGAQSRPVATPSNSEGAIVDFFAEAPRSADADSRSPRATSGLVKRSDRPGNTRVSPNAAKRARAAHLPNAFALTAQPPATAARLATTANVAAIPA